MPARKELPNDYEEYRHQNFTRDSMTYLSNNLLTAVMLIFFFVIFSRYTQLARADFEPVEFLSLKGWEILWLFILAMVMMFAHEAIHWLSFKFLGKADSIFLVKGVTPHTLSSKSYFNKALYIVLKLCPMVVISAIYLLIASVIPFGWIELAIYFFAGNVAYSTPDLVSIVEAIRAPKGALIEDLGEHVYFYADKALIKKRKKMK